MFVKSFLSSTFCRVALLASLSGIVGCNQVHEKLEQMVKPESDEQAIALMADKASEGKVEEAKLVGEEYLKSFGKDVDGNVHLEVGRMLVQMGRLNEAVSYLEESVKRSEANIREIVKQASLMDVWVRREQIRQLEINSSNSLSSSKGEGSSEETIRAGNVSITKSNGKTESRAGNVVIRE